MLKQIKFKPRKRIPVFSQEFVLKEFEDLSQMRSFQAIINHLLILFYAEIVSEISLVPDLEKVKERIQELVPDEVIEENRGDLEVIGFFGEDLKIEKKKSPFMEYQVKELISCWRNDASFTRWRCADT